MKQFTMTIENANKLYDLHADYMYYACSSRYKAGRSYNALTEFTKFCKSIGIDNILLGERLANTVWSNYDYIKEQADKGKKLITLMYDLDTPYTYEAKAA